MQNKFVTFVSALYNRPVLAFGPRLRWKTRFPVLLAVSLPCWREVGPACAGRAVPRPSAAYCFMLPYLEFQSLAFGQQDEYVRAHGHYQAQRWHENYSIELYQLPGFYCELWLEQECMQLPHYRVFTTDAYLANYKSAESDKLY